MQLGLLIFATPWTQCPCRATTWVFPWSRHLHHEMPFPFLADRKVRQEECVSVSCEHCMKGRQEVPRAPAVSFRSNAQIKESTSTAQNTGAAYSTTSELLPWSRSHYQLDLSVECRWQCGLLAVSRPCHLPRILLLITRVWHSCSI